MKISSRTFLALATMASMHGPAHAVLVDTGNAIRDVSPNHDSLHHLFQERAVNCAKITGVLAVVKALGPLATSFCRTFVHSPGVTTLPPVPATLTSLTTTTGAPVTTTVATVTTGSPVIIPVTKRRARRAPSAVPGALVNFAASEISSACRCLNLAPTATVGGATVTVATVASTITAPGAVVPVTETITTCSPSGGPCTLYNNCCAGICAPVIDAVSVYSCYA